MRGLHRANGVYQWFCAPYTRPMVSPNGHVRYPAHLSQDEAYASIVQLRLFTVRPAPCSFS